MIRRCFAARLAFCAGFAFSLSRLTMPVAVADVLEWTNAVNGNFATPVNWNLVSGPGPAPPGAGDTARFNEVAAPYTVTFTSSPTSDLLDFDAGIVTFRSSGADRTYNLTSGSADALIGGGNLTLGVPGDPLNLNVGDALSIVGAATLNADFGSDVTAGRLQVGLNNFGGTAVFDGAGSKLKVNTLGVFLGSSGGTGTLTFQNGSTGNVINGTTNLIASSGVLNSTGRVNVLSGSTLTTDNIIVGNSSSSTLVQEATLTVAGTGSVLTMSGASALDIGDDLNPNIVADLIVSNFGQFHTGTGATSIRNSGHLDIQSNGTFTSNGPLTADGTDIDVASSGVFANGVGSSLTAFNGAQLRFDGDHNIDNGVTWTLQSGADYITDSSSDDLFIGNSTNGTLIVEGSGTTVNLSAGGNGLIGRNGGAGTLTVRDSATATFDFLDVGDDSDAGTTGILNIEDGAQVTANSVDVAENASSTAAGTINIGGTTGTTWLTINGAGRLDVGGTVFSGGAGTINITNSLGRLISGTGQTTIDQSGLIEIDDGLFQANGNVLIDGGELREVNHGTFDLEPGLTLTAENIGQVNFDTSYDIDEDTTFLIQSGADFSVTSFLDIGDGSGESGTLTVEGTGSSLTVTSIMSIGRVGGTGNLTLRGNATASLNGVSIVTAVTTGVPTTGAVLVESGADVTSGTLLVGAEGGVGNAASLTITGTSSTWAASALTLGDNTSGTAEMHVLDGGSFTSSSTADFRATGVMTIDGGAVDLGSHSANGGRIDFVSGSLTSGNDWTVEPGGILGHLVDLTPAKHLATTGTSDDLILEAGGTVVLNGGSLDVDDIIDNGGTFQFNSGTLTLSGFNAFNIAPASIFGAGFTLGSNQHVVLSNQAVVAAGSVLTLSGGTLNSTARLSNNGITTVGAGSLLDVTQINNNTGALLSIGAGAQARVDGTIASSNPGEIVLGGPGAIFRNDSTQPLASSGLIRGDGAVTGLVNNSGELRASSGERLFLPDGFNGSNGGLISLQGGTVETGVSLTNNASGNIVGRGTLRTGGTGMVNQGDVAFSNGVTDVFGDVDNQTTGRVIVSGNADVTFWDDVTHTGTLFNVSTGSSVTFFGTAGFSVSGGGDVFFEADVTPGSSPGLENFGGNVSLGVLANLAIEIGGTTKGSEYDALDIAGIANLGGTLDVSLLGGFMPQVGDSFEIITAANVVDMFTLENLPSIGNLIWNVNYSATSVVLEVNTPFTADFDLDGDVDGDDLAQWRGDYGLNGFSDADGDGDSDGADLLAWQRQFTGPLVAAATTAVPEPSTTLLCALAILLGSFRFPKLLKTS
ncbi:MAG: hypothetical protein MI725_14125 [Pirellulales bacterium]|nr:hypothetical protein [Pirellulales bacterium]